MGNEKYIPCRCKLPDQAQGMLCISSRACSEIQLSFEMPPDSKSFLLLSESRYSSAWRMAEAPSPTAVAIWRKFPLTTSPAANTPGTLVCCLRSTLIKPSFDFFDLPVEIRQLAFRTDLQKVPSSAGAKISSARKLSPEMLIEILNDCDWNKAEVGRRLGLSRTAIWKYMKKWNIPLKRPNM